MDYSKTGAICMPEVASGNTRCFVLTNPQTQSAPAHSYSTSRPVEVPSVGVFQVACAHDALIRHTSRGFLESLSSDVPGACFHSMGDIDSDKKAPSGQLNTTTRAPASTSWHSSVNCNE